MKKCPFCAEEIQDQAVVCRFCGRELEPGQQQKAHQAPTQEETLTVVHPSLWVVFKEIIMMFIVVFASIFLYKDWHPTIWLLTIVPVLAIYIWVVRIRHKYTITTRRVNCREGLIAKNTNEVDIKDVRSVNVRQGVLQRIINIGDVLIGTAGTEGVEIALIGISRPHRVKDLILDQKK